MQGAGNSARIVIARNGVGHAVKRKLTVTDTVAEPADGGTKVEVDILITGHLVETERNIGQFAVTVRSPKANHAGTVVDHVHGDTAGADQMELFDLQPGLGFTERRNRHRRL